MLARLITSWVVAPGAAMLACAWLTPTVIWPPLAFCSVALIGATFCTPPDAVSWPGAMRLTQLPLPVAITSNNRSQLPVGMRAPLRLTRLAPAAATTLGAPSQVE